LCLPENINGRSYELMPCRSHFSSAPAELGGFCRDPMALPHESYFFRVALRVAPSALLSAEKGRRATL